jgi:hypothetical protein
MINTDARKDTLSLPDFKAGVDSSNLKALNFLRQDFSECKFATTDYDGI